MANEQNDPDKGSLNQNGGCFVDHCLVIPENVLKVSIGALQSYDLLDPDTIAGCRDYRVNNAAKGTKQQQHFQHKNDELLLERFLDIQIGKLLNDLILGQHHRIVCLPRLDVDHMADDEVYPEENDQHQDARNGDRRSQRKRFRCSFEEEVIRCDVKVVIG